jgi:hypothetical protein
MHDVGMTLKTRLFEMETNKRAKRRADELSRRQKEAHEDMTKASQSHDRTNVFDNTLSSLFMNWATNLWRQSTLFVTMKELVSTKAL